MVAPEENYPARARQRSGPPFAVFASPPVAAGDLLRDRRVSLALRSLAALVFGLAFLWPHLPEAMLVRLFAAYAFADGMLALAPGGWAPPHRLGWPLLIGGCIDLAAGGAVYASLWSGMPPNVLGAIATVWAIAASAAFTLAYFALREWDRDQLFLLGGIASLLFGRALLSQLATDPVVLSAWLGFYALTMAVLFLKLTLKHYRVLLL